MGLRKSFTRKEAIRIIRQELVSNLPENIFDKHLLVDTVVTILTDKTLFKKPLYADSHTFTCALKLDIDLFIENKKKSTDQIVVTLENYFRLGKINRAFKEFPVAIPFIAFSCPTTVVAIVNLIISLLK